MSADIIIDGNYEGYTYLGHAVGNMVNEQTGEKRPYYNLYVASPVSSYKSEDYAAFGFKAEKKKCISADVWNGLELGCRIKLFFDDKKRVVMVALDD